MKTRLLILLPTALSAAFMLLPLLCLLNFDAYSASGIKLIVLPIIVFPLAAYASGLAAALRHGFMPLMALLTGAAFIPAAILHYGASAMRYAAVYAGVSAMAQATAYPFNVMRKAGK